MDKRSSRLHTSISAVHICGVRGFRSRRHRSGWAGAEIPLSGLQTGRVFLRTTSTVANFLKHLVPFLPDLHTFTSSVGTKLAQEDKVVVYEAIAHVISAMPMDQAAQSLKTFSANTLAAVFTIASKPGVATKQELQDVGSTFLLLFCVILAHAIS
jgi:hypothetical protein